MWSRMVEDKAISLHIACKVVNKVSAIEEELSEWSVVMLAHISWINRAIIRRNVDDAHI